MSEKTVSSFQNSNGLGNVGVSELQAGRAVSKAPLVQC